MLDKVLGTIPRVDSFHITADDVTGFGESPVLERCRFYTVGVALADCGGGNFRLIIRSNASHYISQPSPL